MFLEAEEVWELVIAERLRRNAVDPVINYCREIQTISTSDLPPSPPPLPPPPPRFENSSRKTPMRLLNHNYHSKLKRPLSPDPNSSFPPCKQSTPTPSNSTSPPSQLSPETATPSNNNTPCIMAHYQCPHQHPQLHCICGLAAVVNGPTKMFHQVNGVMKPVPTASTAKTDAESINEPRWRGLEWFLEAYRRHTQGNKKITCFLLNIINEKIFFILVNSINLISTSNVHHLKNKYKTFYRII